MEERSRPTLRTAISDPTADIVTPPTPDQANNFYCSQGVHSLKFANIHYNCCTNQPLCRYSLILSCSMQLFLYVRLFLIFIILLIKETIQNVLDFVSLFLSVWIFIYTYMRCMSVYLYTVIPLKGIAKAYSGIVENCK